MITRKEYMNGECSHHDYYAQFCDDTTKNALLSRISKDRILNSTDEHLNDIPLKEWGALPLYSSTASKIREASGSGPALSDSVCVYKTQAKLIQMNLVIS